MRTSRLPSRREPPLAEQGEGSGPRNLVGIESLQLLGGSDARGPRGGKEDLPGAPASRERCGFPTVPSVCECAVEGASPVLRGQERTAASPLSRCPLSPLSPLSLSFRARY